MEGQVQSARALPHALRDGPITDYKRLKALTFLKKNYGNKKPMARRVQATEAV